MIINFKCQEGRNLILIAHFNLLRSAFLKIPNISFLFYKSCIYIIWARSRFYMFISAPQIAQIFLISCVLFRIVAAVVLSAANSQTLLLL
jgi:hypothetical protein